VEVTGTGQPMILIPGLSCGGNVWDGTVAHFKNKYQCHVVTLAGFAGQPAIGTPFLHTALDQLIGYIREQKLARPILIGHSLGGFLAFWLGSTIPDQVGPIVAVDGVPFYSALMDPNATGKSSEAMAQGAWMGFVMQSPEQFAKSNEKNLAAMITDPKEVRRIADLSNRSDPKTVGQAVFEVMTTDLRPKVSAIQSPVLLLGATASFHNPEQRKKAEESYRLQIATIPKHKVVFAPKARHFIQLDEPDFFFHEVEAFLSEAGKSE